MKNFLFLEVYAKEFTMNFKCNRSYKEKHWKEKHKSYESKLDLPDIKIYH